MTINEIQDEIIEEFAGLDDWMDKYQLLIDLGNEQEPLEDQYKTEQNLIDGCQSRVWLVAELVNQGESPHDLRGAAITGTVPLIHCLSVSIATWR